MHLVEKLFGEDRFLKIVFIIVTLLYGLVIPPFEVRDEPAHFARAVQYARWAFPSATRNGEPGAMLPTEVVDFIQGWPPSTMEHINRRSVAALSAPAAHESEEGGKRAFAGFGYIGSYPPFLYFPQAIGMRVARAWGAGTVLQFYAGRFAAGLIAIAAILTAIRILPFGGRAMLLIAALPGVSWPLASFSADSMLCSIAFLTIAMALRVPATASAGLRWTWAALVPLLAMTKGVYLPLACSGLAQPGARRLRALLWVGCPAIAGAGLFVIWFGVLAVQGISVQHYVSSRTLERVVAPGPSAQLGWVAGHPASFAWAIATTIVRRAPAYAVDCIGRFGWFHVLLPAPLYGVGIMVAAAGTFVTSRRQALPSTHQRALWLAIVAVIVVLTHAALYLTSTALGEPLVEGVQGRYFIPFLPLLALSMQFRTGDRLGRVVEAALPWAGLSLMAGGVATAVLAFWRW